VLGISALELLSELRIGFTSEERQVLGHLRRPVARRERVNANAADASLVRIFELVSGRSTIPASLTLSDLCHVFAIAKLWQASSSRDLELHSTGALFELSPSASKGFYLKGLFSYFRNCENTGR
jgi:hypothetical protein